MLKNWGLGLSAESRAPKLKNTTILLTNMLYLSIYPKVTELYIILTCSHLYRGETGDIHCVLQLC